MIDFDDDLDDDLDDEWEGYHGKCQACDRYGPVDDLSLCQDCRTKIERDLVRMRDWDYSAWAFGLSDEGKEELYRQVIAEHGQALELLAPRERSRRRRSGSGR